MSWENKHFESPCPLKREQLEQLFTHIDKMGLLRFSDGTISSSCDHTLNISIEFAKSHNLNEEVLVDWLIQHGGCCDCEVLLNTTMYYEEAIEDDKSLD